MEFLNGVIGNKFFIDLQRNFSKVEKMYHIPMLNQFLAEY
jgi:hypothetical protein